MTLYINSEHFCHDTHMKHDTHVLELCYGVPVFVISQLLTMLLFGYMIKYAVSVFSSAASEHIMTNDHFVLLHNYQSCLQLAGKGLNAIVIEKQHVICFKSVD